MTERGVALPLTREPLVTRQRVWRRAPDPAWVRELAEISPPTHAHTWLHLAWEPGDPWAPVERWVVWQMRPAALLAADEGGHGGAILGELRGPAPRSTGHYCGPSSTCGCKPHLRPDAWVGGACHTIDQAQWELHRDTGCFGTRWWIVQGTGGGHLRRFSRMQSMCVEMAGGPADPPVPGEFAYAPPDGRTWAAIRAYDAMAHVGRLLERSPDELNAAERAEAEAGQAKLLAWMGAQMRDAIDAGGAGFRRAIQDVRAPRWQWEPEPDYEALEESFITDVD